MNRHITIYENLFTLGEVYFDERVQGYRQYRGSIGRNYVFSSPAGTPDQAKVMSAVHPLSPEYIHKSMRTRDSRIIHGSAT